MSQIMFNQENSQITLPKNNPFVFILKRFLITIIILAIIVGIVSLIIYFKSKNNANLIDQNVSAYSAVFLTNGQVYFGKIGVTQNNYLILSDIYYFSPGNDQSQNKNNASGATLSLIKLGSEIHGPTNTMYINSASILFYENLRPDSKVVQSIEKGKSTPF